MQERRRYRRNRTLKGGRLCWADGTVECVVRDISEAGAGARVTSGRSIPSELDLALLDGNLMIRSFVKWRGINMLGLEFDRSSFGGFADLGSE